MKPPVATFAHAPLYTRSTLLRLPTRLAVALLVVPAAAIALMLNWTSLAVRYFQHIVGDMPICYARPLAIYEFWSLAVPVAVTLGMVVLCDIMLLRWAARSGLLQRTWIPRGVTLLLLLAPLCLIPLWLIVGDLFYFSDIFS